MAGRKDFTPDEWATMQLAMMASGVLVSMADGSVDPDEIHVLTKELRSVRFAHRSQLLHELANVPNLDTRWQPESAYGSYSASGLEAIRSACGTIARKAPDELSDFREFLLRLAELVADSNSKGSLLGVGAQRRTPEEITAIDSVKGALGLI